jgi:hypothetical protein
MSESLRREREPRNPEELIFSLDYGTDRGGNEEDSATESSRDDSHSPETTGGEAEYTHALIHRSTSSQAIYRLEKEGLENPTEYAICFVPESMAYLSVYDVLADPTLDNTPLSQLTLESLPAWARAKLRREGHLKCTGEYNKETDLFETLSPGWKALPTNQADELVQILEEVGDEHFVAAVYYFLHANASASHADLEAIASLRDIQPSSVMNSIREVQKRLEDSSL